MSQNKNFLLSDIFHSYWKLTNSQSLKKRPDFIESGTMWNEYIKWKININKLVKNRSLPARLTKLKEALKWAPSTVMSVQPLALHSHFSQQSELESSMPSTIAVFIIIFLNSFWFHIFFSAKSTFCKIVGFNYSSSKLSARFLSLLNYFGDRWDKQLE